MAWKLRLKDHQSGSVSEQTLDLPIVQIGRDPNCDVVLAHGRVSRRHVELRKSEAGTTKAIDLSSNGTFVREQDEWVRIENSLELGLPVTLRVGHWTVKIEEITVVAPYQEDPEQSWDESVMVPVANLGHRTEAIIVFDLCGSSMIANKDDHMAYHLKQRLSQIAEPILDEYGRRFFKGTGDGFLATFEAPEKALQAAIKVEDHVQYRNLRTTNEPIHYRIALHYGEVWAIGGDDVHGNDVNITFRIEGVQSAAFAETKVLFPKRDRILCSARFREALHNETEWSPIEYMDCGAATLKGIVDAVDIYWLKTQYSGEGLDSILAVRMEPK